MKEKNRILRPNSIITGTKSTYHVLDEVERGVAGEVATARDNTNGRKVFLKAALRESAFIDAIEKERTVLERANQRIGETGVVKLLDFGVTNQEGIPTLVLEDLGEMNLEKIISKYGPLKRKTSIRIMKQIAKVAAKLAEEGIFHRDIKPANIVYVPKRGPVLIDFGISEIRSIDVTIVNSNQVIGTPLYMGDEVFAGRYSQRSSEVFSIAMTGLALIYGEDACTPKVDAWNPYFMYRRREIIKKLTEELPELEREIFRKSLALVQDRESISEFIRTLETDQEPQEQKPEGGQNAKIYALSAIAGGLIAYIQEVLSR